MSFNLQVDLDVTLYSLIIAWPDGTLPKVKLFNTIEEAREYQGVLKQAGLNVDKYTDVQEHTLKLT